MLGGGTAKSAKKRQLGFSTESFSCKPGWRILALCFPPELTDERPSALIYTCYEVLTLQGENGDRWRLLCERAATEQDPARLMELVREINRLLEEKEERLQAQPIGKSSAA
jgi:hypothetical protein